LNVSVKNGERLGLEQIQAFLEAADGVEFEATKREEVYSWISRTLCEQEYWKQSKQTKGLLRRYVQKMTGLSRAPVTRLMAAYLEQGTVKRRAYRRHRFPTRYTSADVALWAQGDEAHETLNGPATRKMLQREFEAYGDRR
jgi:hypothetical protein